MLTWKSKGRAQKARQRGRTSARRAAGRTPSADQERKRAGPIFLQAQKMLFGQAGHLGKAGNILHRPGTCWRKYRPE